MVSDHADPKGLQYQPRLCELAAFGAFAAFHSNLSGRSRFGEDFAAGPRSHCGMKTTVMNPVKGFTLFALGLAIAAMGIYVADADDAPGAAVIGMLLSGWSRARFAAFLSPGVVVTAPLFPQSQAVPSVVDSARSPQYAAAVERAPCAQPYWSKTCPGRVRPLNSVSSCTCTLFSGRATAEEPRGDVSAAVLESTPLATTEFQGPSPAAARSDAASALRRSGRP